MGNDNHFAAAGSFHFLVPAWNYEMLIQSPGYVPVRIPVAAINSCEAVSIPEQTLAFGDANGDGGIDILDLNIAAGNVGMTVTGMLLPRAETQ